jgi:hypothetical protein
MSTVTSRDQPWVVLNATIRDRTFVLPLEQVPDQRRTASCRFVGLTPCPAESDEVFQHEIHVAVWVVGYDGRRTGHDATPTKSAHHPHYSYLLRLCVGLWQWPTGRQPSQGLQVGSAAAVTQWAPSWHGSVCTAATNRRARIQRSSRVPSASRTSSIEPSAVRKVRQADAASFYEARAAGDAGGCGGQHQPAGVTTMRLV